MIAAFIIGGSLVHLAATLVYVRNTLLGRTKPNRVTFFLWTAVPMIAVVAGRVVGGGWALVPVFMSGFAPGLVFVASFFNRNAYWKLGVFDYVCGALSVLAIFLWVYTNNPTMAVIFSILADAAAGFPTLVKAWRYPETETGFSFAVALITEGVGLFALTTGDFAEYGFLAYLTVLNFALIYGIYRTNPLAKLKEEFAR